ncbi:MAG: 30S ribosomal protein S4 [Bacilli bacterium]|nr:30S ribosomal protein S4 [Bacilli bacterium]
MSRYTGPAYKKSRRVAFSTLENGKDLAKRSYKPGQHGQDRKAKPSNYSEQLNEKQKVKFTYGMTEKQFRQLFNKAGKMEGIHGENFLKLLESRLDNIVYRMGLSATRRGARQIVNHGHILVNGRKVNIPSFIVKPGDVVSVKEASKEHKAIKSSLEAINKTVDYVNFDKNKLEGTYVRYPERSELSLEFNESLIVEYYSR